MRDLINGGMLASEAARAVQAGEHGAVSAARDVADLGAAARSLDTARCDALLDDLFSRRGVLDAWEQVCCPALLAVDAHPRNDPAVMAAEHALSWALLGALRRIPAPPAAPGAALVLLACSAGEQHTLPLAALAAALAEHAIPVRMLGAATPALSVERAVQETGADAVVVWAQRAETAGSGVLRALSRYPVRRLAAGPGWDDERAAGARRVTSLGEALAVLVGQAGFEPIG